MNILLALLIIYITPILIIWVIMYLLMKKGQTIEEFVEESECFSTDFIVPIIIPFINVGLMIHTIVIYLCYKFKNWRK